MSDSESSRRSPVDRSESPRDDSRNRYSRRSSPSRRVHRRQYSNAERRDHPFRREHRDRRYNERENPEESRCLGVFGMSTYTREEELREVFSPYGRIEKIQIIYDAKTSHSRGYSFIYFENVEDAKEAKEHCNDLEIGGKTIRVDFSVTNRAHSPTPGQYMGRRNPSNYEGRHRRERDDGDSSRYDSRYGRDSYRRYERTSRRTHSKHRSRNYSRSPRR